MAKQKKYIEVGVRRNKQSNKSNFTLVAEEVEDVIKNAHYIFDLSDNQEKLADLYVQAKGKCFIWKQPNTGKIKIINPDDLTEYRGGI